VRKFLQPLALLLFSLMISLGRAGDQDAFTPPSSTDSNAQIEARVADLLGKLTLDEKIALLSGPDWMHTAGVPRLGIPALKFSDATAGVRCWGPSTAYPAPVLLAATWDPALAREMGRAVGRDARARGVNVVLGPGVNICREAQNGRNFEYMGEDPRLASAIAADYIRGVQGEGVAACVKHFAVNEEETERGSINMIVSRRALEEIYLPPFRAAIEQGGVWTAMAAYNKVNGAWCTANDFLLTDVLRKEWHFQGVLMSDWDAVHETQGDLNAGMDLEMHGSPRLFYNRGAIKPLLDSGAVSQATLDEHVRRVLRLIVAMGFMEREQTDASIPQDDPANAAVAQKVASEGIVLLRNAGSFLPLDRAKVKHIFVMGPNAQEAVIGGGGSAGVTPFSAVSVLDGIRAVVGPGVEVECLPPSPGSPDQQGVFQPAEGQGPGLSAEYFANHDLAGSPKLKRVDQAVDFTWNTAGPVPGIAGDAPFSVRWQGTITAPESGSYVFSLSTDQGARVLFDGRVIMEIAPEHPTLHKEIQMDLTKGETHRLRIDYFNQGGGEVMRFGWGKADLTPEQKAKIAAADAVVYAGGLNPRIEHEGVDRPWGAPASQVQELQQVLALNPHVILAVNAGADASFGDVEEQVPALLWCWYPGENGNIELAKILFGDTNPSGRLPDTFEKRFEDSPAYGNFPGDQANGGSVNLAEGIYVGYRWYDKKNIAPAYPFGFGLSYTTFALKNLQVRSQSLGDSRRFAASVDVTNTGSRAGAEVVQLYVRPQDSADRPVQELKAFQRVELSPGETKSVALPLTARDFALFDEKTSAWTVPPGSYQIAIGMSSRDIAQQAEVKLP
jgi:beta-glucosidase